MTSVVTPIVKRHLAVTLGVTCVTAWFSYAYFNIDEHFQVIEPALVALGQAEDWALPWEIHERMRPWLQSFVYWAVGRALGVVSVRDPFTLAFAWRLLTGICCVGSLALFVKATLPWLATDEEKRLHLRTTTLAGFLPYLFVRTSSETFSMAAATAGFALLALGARAGETPRAWRVPAVDEPRRLFVGGLLFGVAFEARYQTALVALGVVAWLVAAGGARARALAWLGGGGVLALVVGALADRWGYGVWTFPAWRYFRANAIEGAASYFGTDPPLSYFWMLPANVFFPVVVALLLLAVVAWIRAPWHPLTWATLPFFAVHNLIPHKEERFVFPIAILATGLVALAIAPSAGRPLAVASWAWARRGGALAKALAGASFATMALLAIYPLGWHHHVRFQRWVHENVGDELHAHALPEFELGLPAYHPRVYDVEKSDAASIVRRIDEGTAKPWVIADTPELGALSPPLAERVTLVWSELPCFGDAAMTARAMRLVDAYNARAQPPLRRLEYRSIYRVSAPRPPTTRGTRLP